MVPDAESGEGRPTVRVLLVADTHIGFDLPHRPRLQRRRRGHDFMANYRRALAPALAGQADLVVHGGDLLYRSRVPAGLVEEALAPLARVAAAGVPVFLVPGNHERAAVPRTLSCAQPGLHVFLEPQTFMVRVRSVRVAVCGFPFVRRPGTTFAAALAATGHEGVPADVRLLCAHQAFEGARVGPADFVFRRGPKVIAGRDIPAGFAAVLAGHVHRAQVIRRDLAGRPLAAPVIYPGSVERTSFAERSEDKHFAVVDVAAHAASGGRLTAVTFHPLPARPMVTICVDAAEAAGGDLEAALRRRLADVPADAVVQVRLPACGAAGRLAVPSAARLRSMVPPTVNIALRPGREE